MPINLQPNNAHDLRIQSNIVVAFIITFLVLTTTAVSLRVYVKTRLLRSFGLDDWAMMLAYLFFISTSSMTLVNANLSFLHNRIHSVDGEGIFLALLRWDLAAYVLSVTTFKISWALFMLQIFRPPFMWQRRVIYGLTIPPTVLGLTYAIMAVSTCGIFVQWTNSTCAAEKAFNHISLVWSLLNAAADLGFAGLCLLSLINANLAKIDKIVACLLLTLGTVGGIASVLRATVFLGLYSPNGGQVREVLTCRWSIIEAGLCITAACLSTLRPLFRKRPGGTDESPSTEKKLRNRVPDHAAFLTLAGVGHQVSDEARKLPTTGVVVSVSTRVSETIPEYRDLELNVEY